MIFYTGTHMVNHACHLDHSMISVNRLINRKSDFEARNWIMDSGAFTRLSTHGEHWPLWMYVEQIDRWRRCGRLNAAVTQDYMCEPFILAKTDKTVAEHQTLTIDRYQVLKDQMHGMGVYLMPVLQGFNPAEYVDHIRQYGKLLWHRQWVGVGSVCKRNSDVRQIRAILGAIKKKRPDLRLHGFGLKLTALADGFVRECLWSADSMAWSFAARKNGRNGNGLDEAVKFSDRVAGQIWQRTIFGKAT